MKNEMPEGKQRQVFAAVNRRFGLGATDSTYDPKAYAGKPLVYSSDPVQSDVPPKIVHAHSIAELKALIGAPAGTHDDAVEYPAAIPAGQQAVLSAASSRDDLLEKLPRQLRSNLEKAYRAYLQGNPEKVKDYEPILNALMFPMPVAYFAADATKVIDQPITVTGSDPVAWNYDAITFQAGGSITADVEFKISCNTMTKTS